MQEKLQKNHAKGQTDKILFTKFYTFSPLESPFGFKEDFDSLIYQLARQAIGIGGDYLHVCKRSDEGIVAFKMDEAVFLVSSREHFFVGLASSLDEHSLTLADVFFSSEMRF